MEIILISLVAAAGLLMIFTKILGFSRLLKYQIIVDLISTVGLPGLFFGTFAGMAVAFLAGLWISMFLMVAGKLAQIKSIIRSTA